MNASQNAAVPVTLNENELTRLRATVGQFSRDQLLWSSGYLAGLATVEAAGLERGSERPASQSTREDTWSIFYATETGNSRKVAEQLSERARLSGLNVSLADLKDVRPKSLKTIARAVFVLATHGIGEPPEGTEAFFDYWFSDKAARLDELDYSVLALGDSSYADFCEIGQRFDARLTELGATAVVERTDCDLDFDQPSQLWSEKLVAHASEAISTVTEKSGAQLVTLPTQHRYTRMHPLDAEILTNQRITGRDSSKDVRHIELDLEGSGLIYAPGDSIGVLASNPLPVVEQVLDAAGLVGDETVRVGGETRVLHEALAQSLEITRLSRPFLDGLTDDFPQIVDIVNSRESFTKLLATRQLVDVLTDYAKSWDAQRFVDGLRKLPPRQYSIASSPDLNQDEAHLTVSVVDYEAFDRRHLGAASNFLAENTNSVSVYVDENDQFRLPVDSDSPIIMVGAGTGIAPYRAFVEHRHVHGHRGKNWLFFGERSMSEDFLYQLEWLRYRKEGILSRLNTAFSRDQSAKIYVQHRLLEQARDVFRWLEDGAYFYVCGDATQMAVDVDSVLHLIVQQGLNGTKEQAADYVRALRHNGRYLKDVY